MWRSFASSTTHFADRPEWARAQVDNSAESVETDLLNDDYGKTSPVLVCAFSPKLRKRPRSLVTLPPRIACFDIFAPPPGDSDLISQVERQSSQCMGSASRSTPPAPV